MKPSRVHPFEWLTGLLGLAVIAGLLLPWSGDESALASPGLLDVLLLLIGVAAVIIPVACAMSSRTNVPIVSETLLWIVSGLFALILIVKALFPPAGGFDNGFWLVLASTFVMSFALWRSVDRER